MTNNETLILYFDKYGHTLNIINYPIDIMPKVYAEMKSAIDGERGELTDEEFDQSIPEGADA